MKRRLTGKLRERYAAQATVAFGAVLLYALLRGLPRAAEIAKGVAAAAAPVMIGLALAFVLELPVGFLERNLFRRLKRRAARALSLVMTLALLAGFTALLAALICPRLIESAKLLASNAERYMEGVRALIARAVALFRPRAEAEETASRLMRELTEKLGGSAEELLDRLPGMTFSAVTAVYRTVLTVVICAHSLIPREGLIRFFRRAATAALPKGRIEGFFRGCAEANVIFRKYVGAQLISALLIGGAGYLGMRLLRLRYPELIAVFCAAGALIPIVGPWASIGASAFITMMSGPPINALWFVLMMLGIQLVEDNAVYPRLIGGAIGMTGLEVLAAVIIGGGLFGVPGLLAAVPTAAVLRRLLRRAIDSRNAARAEAGETA